MVIVSITGWDGTRVLGAFSDKETALTCLEKSSIKCDHNLIFDFVELNKISMVMNITPDLEEPISRKHIYDDKIS